MTVQVRNKYFFKLQHTYICIWVQTHDSTYSNAINIILGVAIDDSNDEGIILIKKKGKVKMLQDEIESREKDLNFEKVNKIELCKAWL